MDHQRPTSDRTVIPVYPLFHVIFILPAILILAATALRSDLSRLGIPLAILVPLGWLYTVPWEWYLIRRGVWSYGAGSVLDTIWQIPISEFAFISFQILLTSLWVSHLNSIIEPSGNCPTSQRVVGGVAGLAVGIFGFIALTKSSTYYLGAILAWSGPIFAVQWAFDWPFLWKHRQKVSIGVVVPTVYLCGVDRVAIWYGIWELSDHFTTGVTIGGLPVEEGVFFLFTNLFVVQGLLLIEGVLNWL